MYIENRLAAVRNQDGRRGSPWNLGFTISGRREFGRLEIRSIDSLLLLQLLMLSLLQNRVVHQLHQFLHLLLILFLLLLLLLSILQILILHHRRLLLPVDLHPPLRQHTRHIWRHPRQLPQLHHQRSALQPLLRVVIILRLLPQVLYQ